MEQKNYNHQEHEARIYQMWEEGGYFAPSGAPDAQTFCIIMPPPNANGNLHIGHALMLTVEDIMTRYNRMRGKRTLWLPGADHAGFETQVVFERKLEKEGKTRLDMQRADFYKAVWDFTQENRKTMERQTRVLGASCDWSRVKFTLDPDIVRVVYHTFATLYRDGAVYRGERPVNFCTKHQTSFSDLEVKYEERTEALYYVKYPLADAPDEYITVATVRPETIWGDVAVAVHPKDERYARFVGKQVRVPLGGRLVPVIADELVEREFGTGALKITPAHDMTDWEIGKKHNLAAIATIDKAGKMNANAGPYAGLSVAEARARAVQELGASKLLDRVDSAYPHSVGTCYKCGTVIEPMVLPQWFVRMEPLARKAKEVIENDTVRFVPDYFKKQCLYWLENIKDWNISRQIAWGIPIPAYFCECGEVTVDIDKRPAACPRCGSTNLTQDPDTFDTWFSSGQWPYATLLTTSPRKPASPRFPRLPWTSDDFEAFYPTSVMETGYEILFFWIARMIMLGLSMAGNVPFATVYLHGTVRDQYKQKMSKSKGNVVNPLDIIETHGADALRMGLVVGNSPGTDLALREDKIKGYRFFANKLWNISRFVSGNLGDGCAEGAFKPMTDADKEMLASERTIVEAVTQHMEQNRFYQAGEVIYDYIWHGFADTYLERSKEQLKNPETAENTKQILLHCLLTALKLLHPFMPFVTEAVWEKLPHADARPLIVQPWPAMPGAAEH